MGSMHDIDYRQQAIPQSWTEAANEAPGAGVEFQAVSDGPKVRVLPTPAIDMFTAVFAALAMCMISGYTWFELHNRGVTNPWLAVVLGLLIALTLRLSVGRHDTQTRAVMGLVFYLVTATLVIFLLASRNYESLYGTTPSWGQFEDELFHSQLTSIWSLVA
ncbi:MAG: hypothetical protein AAFN30_05590, partial [Actinomycetota bacterium]